MNHQYRLTKMTAKGGCAAKQGPKVLRSILDQLPKMCDDNMLVGFESNDDAAVYKLNEKQALVQTVDFFPAPVDDPYLFGQIAAANALSDVYAMGGTPILALNLFAFPACLDKECIRLILEGGYQKVLEAGAVVAGGHTIDDPDPKYGLSVSGIVDPENFWQNNKAQVSDVLILTKPIGVGIYTLACRGELLNEEDENLMIYWMTMLNKKAKEVFSNYTVHGCTDITGFGLLGHMYEMADGSQVTVEIDLSKVPLLDRAAEFAEMGIVPAGTYKNKEYIEEFVQFENGIEEKYKDCLMDPQTSGGLVAAIPESEAERCLLEMRENGCFATVIGKIKEKGITPVIVKKMKTDQNIWGKTNEVN